MYGNLTIVSLTIFSNLKIMFQGEFKNSCVIKFIHIFYSFSRYS